MQLNHSAWTVTWNRFKKKPQTPPCHLQRTGFLIWAPSKVQVSVRVVRPSETRSQRVWGEMNWVCSWRSSRLQLSQSWNWMKRQHSGSLLVSWGVLTGSPAACECGAAPLAPGVIKVNVLSRPQMSLVGHGWGDQDVHVQWGLLLIISRGVVLAGQILTCLDKVKYQF